MPRLASHRQLAQGARSPDKGTPGLQHLVAVSRTCCSRGERTARCASEGHQVPIFLRDTASIALIPEVLPGHSELARSFHSNSSSLPFLEYQQVLQLPVSESCNIRNARLIPITAVPSVRVSSPTLSPLPSSPHLEHSRQADERPRVLSEPGQVSKGVQ